MSTGQAANGQAIDEQATRVSVLMVCLGNICRSPSAHGVLQKAVENNSLADKIAVDSAGTSHYHIGQSPDPRSIQAAARRGYALHELRARQLRDADYQQFDYILAMDAANLQEIRSRAPINCAAHLGLLLDFSDSEQDSVPDPYYSGAEGFELVLDLIEGACDGLLDAIRARHLPELRKG